VDYLNYFGTLITSDAKYTLQIKSRFCMATTAVKEKDSFASILHLNLRTKLGKYYKWNLALYGAET